MFSSMIRIDIGWQIYIGSQYKSALWWQNGIKVKNTFIPFFF